jgi:hypothetical protein
MVMSNTVSRAPSHAQSALTRARGKNGRFQAGEKKHPTTEPKRKSAKRLRNERDYLRAVVAAIGSEDVKRVAAQIVADAESADDAKVVNAAREWIGKYLLGNARTPLDDLQHKPPGIVKRR